MHTAASANQPWIWWTNRMYENISRTRVLKLFLLKSGHFCTIPKFPF